MKPALLLLGSLFLAPTILAQTASSSNDLPCPYSEDVLRDKTGKPLRFTSDQMKARATRRVDVGSNFMGSIDFRGMVSLEVLVSTSGKVLCLRALHEGHPYPHGEVSQAVKQWEFKPSKQNGKPVATLGLLEFYLCNISCGKKGISMSLLPKSQ